MKGERVTSKEVGAGTLKPVWDPLRPAFHDLHPGVVWVRAGDGKKGEVEALVEADAATVTLIKAEYDAAKAAEELKL